MAQKIEKWAASDGSEHPSQEAADAYDNDLNLTTHISKFVDSVYGADISNNTPFKRLEKDVLVMAVFRNRKVLLDILLRHNAGPTLQLGPEQMVSPPKNDPLVVRVSAPTTAVASGSGTPGSNAPASGAIGVPPKPPAKPAEVPENFLFNGNKEAPPL